jgi:hypothetical protein
MDWWINIDHLYTRLGTTSNYSAIAYLHTLQITPATAKPFPACCVFISRSLATASNSGDSSASRAQVLSSRAELNSQVTTARLAAISHQPPSLLFTDWLSTNPLSSLPTELQGHLISTNWVRVRVRESESESESELLYDWRFTANQFFLLTSPLKLTPQ